MTDKNTCLNKTKNGEIQLDENHSYYYQTQLQLFATQKSYCDFYIWTTKDWHWERTLPDETFWGITIPKSEILFMNCILPKLVRKFIQEPKKVKMFQLLLMIIHHLKQYFVIVSSQTFAP